MVRDLRWQPWISLNSMGENPPTSSVFSHLDTLLIKTVVEEQLPRPSKKPSNSSPTIPKSLPSSSISLVRNPALQSNLSGGIVRCDSIAQGLINTVGKHDINIPIVARLQGTNMNEANQLVALPPLIYLKTS